MANFKEMKEHIGHSLCLIEDDYGDIHLICVDCGGTLDTYCPEPVNIWQGKKYGQAGGDLHAEEN